MNFLTFFTATCFLLAMPGPTNTLLATSGAGIGIARSLHLLAAELCGYLAAITLLRLALGPVVSDRLRPSCSASPSVSTFWVLPSCSGASTCASCAAARW